MNGAMNELSDFDVVQPAVASKSSYGLLMAITPQNSALPTTLKHVSRPCGMMYFISSLGGRPTAPLERLLHKV